ncbi:MAG: M60 family metallopeptidase [Porphyromonas sp.]|nr:M60 family metallopeptidase [Porphyromonas sp.]
MSIKQLLLRACLMAALPLTLMASCAKDDGGSSGGGSTTPTTPTSIQIANNPEYIDFKAKELGRDLQVQGGGSNWRVAKKTNVDWLTATRQGNILKLTLTENTSDAMREAELQLSNESSSKTVKVRQLGMEPQILVSNTVLSAPVAGASLDFTITTNVAEYELKLPEWINRNDAARAAMRQVSHSLSVSPNKNDEGRTFTVEVIEKNAPSNRQPIRASFAVTQAGLSSYSAHAADQIVGDRKLTIASGTDSSHQDANSDISKAFDGNFGTIYHSNWSNNGDNYFPITLTLTLATPSEIDYMIYHPRQQGYNGYFKVVDIEYTTDGTNYTRLMTKDFKGASTPTRVDFSGAAGKQIRTVKLIVRSGHGDRQGFASAAEIEFFKRSENAFQPTSLFADELCTTLKAGVTDEAIAACPDPFFRNLAFYMKQGKYSKDYRVADFGSYLNPYDIRTHVTKMQYAYSMLDNPTGISVEAGETLVVIVGDTHDQDNLGIRVIDYHQGGTGDGIYNPRNYPIYKGINKLKMETKGLVYVLNHKRLNSGENFRDNTASDPKIKIHFASGTVNGYFDITKHDANQWRTMLDKAKHQYFDLVGRHSHLAFPVADFKTNTPDGAELAKLYDSIVIAEQELHGLQKYNRTYRNRQLLCPTYQPRAFMYATNEHTAYVPSTFGNILNPNNLRNGVWGPAHEIGHIHQTAPGVLWIGLTECTVNIPSAYVQTTLLGKECRLQVENLENTNHNRYTFAFTNILIKDQAFGPADDVFRKLVPFWQLHLYFGKVLGDSPEKNNDKNGFYAKVFEHYRTAPEVSFSPNQGSRDGVYQLEFALTASKIGKKNLYKFFEKWGFFKAADDSINDYSKRRLWITEPLAQAMRDKIQALNFPEPNVALEYITDRNYELYKNPKDVVVGTATRTGNVIRTENFQNVVAYEVLDANDKVVMATDGVYTNGSSYDAKGYIKTDIPGGTSWQSGYKLRAVAANGNRVVVPVN